MRCFFFFLSHVSTRTPANHQLPCEVGPGGRLHVEPAMRNNRCMQRWLWWARAQRGRWPRASSNRWSHGDSAYLSSLFFSPRKRQPPYMQEKKSAGPHVLQQRCRRLACTRWICAARTCGFVQHGMCMHAGDCALNDDENRLATRRWCSDTTLFPR
jgi:hypothetical protein